MDTRGFAAHRPGGDLEELKYEMPEVGADEVRIEVDFCGLCASDLDMIDGTFAGTAFPAVPGHEVVGRIVESGRAVSTLAVGDRVGVGPLRSACGTCEWCERGESQVCRDNQFTMGAGHFGGLASHVQVTEPFAFLLPDDIDPLSAAPLLCAGGTVFSPLRRYIDGPGRVGVIGVGGLGHLAIQFASAMGHEVVAYSSDPTAEEIESFRHLGAAAVVDIGDERAVRGTRGSIDLMLSLVYGDFDLTPYAAALRPRGTLALIGYTTSDLTPLGKHLVYGERSLVGSAGCSRPHMREMLRFASRHSIGALVEPFPMARVNDAVTRMREGRVRYRAVLTRERTEP